MTTASQDKITVPGDDRLTKLNVSTKTPFWTKILIIKELRVAVGWQTVSYTHLTLPTTFVV